MKYGRVVEDTSVDPAPSATSSAVRISDALTDKDIKRIAFELADIRYFEARFFFTLFHLCMFNRFQEVQPIMERLRELEMQLEDDSHPIGGKGSGKGEKSGSASKKQHNSIKKR